MQHSDFAPWYLACVPYSKLLPPEKQELHHFSLASNVMLQLFPGAITEAPGRDSSHIKYHPWISCDSVFVKQTLVQFGSTAQSNISSELLILLVKQEQGLGLIQ